MNKKRFFISLVMVITLFISGCRPTQGQTTTSPTPLPTTNATTEPITPAPSPTSNATTKPITPTPSDGKYKPPQGNYAYDFSLAKGMGTRLDEHYLPGSFETVQSDAFGSWKSIEFMRIGDKSLL